MFGTERLRALAAVAEHGSVVGAARALHVTAPGVSQQLGKLEKESGHVLLERHGRSVRLTHAGQLLADHAVAVLHRLRLAESELADLRHEILGPLRIGALGSTLRVLVPEALAALVDDHPRLAPTVRDGEAVDLVPRVLNGDLDLALVESWNTRPMPVPEGLAVRTLLTENVDLAVAAEHPLAGEQRVRLDRQRLPWASCPPGTEPYEALVQTVRNLGAEPEVRYTMTEFSTQLALVRQNLAAALVPSIAQQPESVGVRVVRTEPALSRDVQVAWRARAGSSAVEDQVELASPAVRSCVDALESVARSLVP